MDKLILFFDCYIISRSLSCEQTYTNPSFPDLARMIGYREASSTYKHVDKIEVVKYVLASYQPVPWDQVIIRFECEDEDEAPAFAEYARQLFPQGEIVNQRSDTAQKYLAALTPLKRHGNPWVFFSPNNDHPLIGSPSDLLECIRLAEDVEKMYPEHVVSVLYSHFTESQSAVGPAERDWAAFTPNYSAVIGETQVARIVKNSVFMCDSIKVFRLDFLLDAFGNTPTKGRLIRLEETGLYLSQGKREITVCPNREVCRHYDGYMHAIETTPPLFIPDGFFEGKIKVRFGFADHVDGWVNLNPVLPYSYLGGVADLRCFPSELPKFWDGRISELRYADDLASMAGKGGDLFEAHAKIRNPGQENYFGDYYVQSAYRYMTRHGIAVPVGNVSIFKQILQTGERRELNALGAGCMMIFVESGSLRVAQCSVSRGEHAVVLPGQHVNIESGGVTQYTCVKFE